MKTINKIQILTSILPLLLTNTTKPKRPLESYIEPSRFERIDQYYDFDTKTGNDYKITQKQKIKNTTKSFDHYFHKGNELFRAGKVDKAIKKYQKSIECNPSCAQAYFNLGIAYQNKGKRDEAIIAFEHAIQCTPSYSKAHLHLGKALEQKEEIDNALYHYQKAIEYDQTLADGHLAIARLLVNRQQLTQAINHLKKASKLRPNDIAIRFEYANTLNTANRTEKALAIYQTLLTKSPHDASILYNTAYTLKKLGRIDEALIYYNAALEKKPDHAEAHFSRGLAYLVSGNFEYGWPEYEWRWKREKQLTPRNFKQPMWDGSNLHGKKILLHAEQGLGDTLQFIRYAQVVKQYGATVIVAAQNPLIPLLKKCPYIDVVIGLRDPLPHFDVHAPLLSLPYIVKTTEKTIPNTIPYLYANQNLVKQWQDKLAHDKNFKVGICWQGNSRYSTPFLRAVVAAKSVALKEFEPLCDVPGISLYSLQKETGVEQLQELPKDFNLITFNGDFDETNGRFMDTAAVIKNLDLVITIDTSISHLAGGLGVRTWVLLPNPPDWRWLLERNDSPWYPNNMQLFRQPTSGDWKSVIFTIAEELKALMYSSTSIKQNRSQNPAIDIKKSSFSSVNQLEQEVKSIDIKLAALSNTIQHMKGSTHNDPTFAKHVRSFYILHEMRKALLEKIDALQEVN